MGRPGPFVKGFLPEPERELRSDLASFSRDPYNFVRYAYPWGEGELIDSAGPYVWQTEELKALRDHLSNPETRYTPYRSALASGHGIGKSAFISMVINWGLSTCEDAKIVVTAGTGTQLATKTAPEVAKWTRMSINRHWWEVQATSIRVLDPKHSTTWRADFMTWNEQRADAWSGLHNRRKRIIVIYDEASTVGDLIWQTTEGALTDEETEIIWLAFGNPIRNSGKFAECFGSQSHRWRTRHIDSRRVEHTNKVQIQRWIDDWGEDSDFVRVRVRGEFPRAGSSEFIPQEVVARARKFKAVGYESMPVILGLDVARFGDDATKLVRRQGRRIDILATWRGLDTVQVAERVIEKLEELENYQALVIDGDGLGAGVVDQIKFRGYREKTYEFHGSVPANDAKKYFNRRAEVWGALRDALIDGIEVPDDPQVERDLTGPEYGFSSNQQIQLESKDDMKARGLSSPDFGDAAAMTFSVRVAPPKTKPKPQLVYPGEMQNSWMA